MNLKRGLLMLLMLSAMIVTSCDPSSEIDPKYRGVWTVKNSSGFELIVKSNRHDPVNIKNENSSNLYFGASYKQLGEKYDNKYFYDLFAYDTILDSIFILSTKGDTLKNWLEENKDQSGKQYYHHSFWKETQEKKEGHIYINWLFELLPEDIDTSKLTD